jgi:hypothetical protein
MLERSQNRVDNAMRNTNVTRLTNSIKYANYARKKALADGDEDKANVYALEAKQLTSIKDNLYTNN